MRPGLLAIGLAFVVVGGGLVVSFFAFAPSTPMQDLTQTITASQISPNQTQGWSLSTVPAPSGTLALSWTSTARASVTFSKARPCTSPSGACPDGPSLATWSANLSGAWRGTGPVGSLYLLTVNDQVSGVVTLNVTLEELYSDGVFGLSTTDIAMLAIGSVLLLGTGALAVFLGLFLPGGVYRAPLRTLPRPPQFSEEGEEGVEEEPDPTDPARRLGPPP